METGDTLALAPENPIPGKDIEETKQDEEKKNGPFSPTLNEKEMSEPNKLDESSEKIQNPDTKKSEENQSTENSSEVPLESTPSAAALSDENHTEKTAETETEKPAETETEPELESGEPKKVDQIDQTDPTPSSTEIVRTLFVSGLPMDATPRELYLLFRSYKGFIESKLNTARNKYGKVLSPIGFVTFQSREDAEYALDELQDALFDPYLPNTTLRLEFAKSNSKIPSGSTSTSTTVNAKDKDKDKEKEKEQTVEKESEKDKGKKRQFTFFRSLNNSENNSGGGSTATNTNSNTTSMTTTTNSSTSTPYYHPHHPNNLQQQQQQQLHWPHGTASTNGSGTGTGTGSGSSIGAGTGTGAGIALNNPYSYYGTGSTDFVGHFHQGSLPYGQSSSSILSVPSSTTTTAANSAQAQLPPSTTKGSRQNQLQNSLAQLQTLGQNLPPSTAQPCSTLFIGNLGAFVSENELAQLFGNCPGFVGSRLYTKGMSPVAFVRFVDVRCASQAMAALQGSYLRYSDRGGIRIEYARSKMNDRDLGLANGFVLGYANVNPYAQSPYQANCGDQWTPYPLISQDSWIDNREPQQRQREWFPGLERF